MTHDLDEERVAQLLEAINDPIGDHLAGGAFERVKVLEALNVLAMTAALLFAGIANSQEDAAQGERDLAGARAWFNTLLDDNIDSLMERRHPVN
jgi:hypothetical protein